MENYFLTKNTDHSVIKDIDVSTGIITGYFSVFNVLDSDGDVVVPGAFKKTIRENGPDSSKARILHLYMHDPSKILSKPHVLKEDKHGLYFESKISETSLGKDVLQLYRDKVLTEHSIGYQIVKREVDESGKERIQKLVELKLWEGSTVSWGANMEALVSTVKSEGKQGKTFDNIIEKIKALESAVKGTYTDDTARELEIQLNQLKQLVIDSLMEPDSSTQKPIDVKFTIDGQLLANIFKSKIKI